MNLIFLATASLALTAGSISAAGAESVTDPLSFFEGRTEGVSTIKIVAKKPYRSRTVGHGEIRSDGTLHLVQRVEDEGRAAYDRTWIIRRVGPHRFSGTMSEARGTVVIDEIGGRYRFRFKMKGAVSVEQWLAPLSGGKAASSKLTIRKLGVTVGHSEGIIRKP